MKNTPEEAFYSSQNPISNKLLPTAASATCFDKGERYSIIARSLAAEPIRNSNLISELGCGDGSRLLYLQEKYGFSSALGIDLRFTGKVYNEEKQITFLPSNLNQSWPLADSSCDVLVAMMILEHLFDPMWCFREIDRVLSPSGRAFINLPLITSVKNRFRLISGKIPVTSVDYDRWFEEGHWDGFHLHYFTLASIRDLALHSGLKINAISAVGKFSSIKSLFPGLLCDEISIELRKVP